MQNPFRSQALNMSIYLMLVLVVGMLFLPLLQFEIAEAQSIPTPPPEGYKWKEVVVGIVIGTVTTYVTTWILEKLKEKTCSNCSAEVPTTTHHETLHSATGSCGSRYFTCPTASQAAQHAPQTCSNGHPYYSCSSDSTKTYHTTAKTCSNGHTYYACSTEETKNYHTRQAVGSCPDSHVYYRCNATDLSRHNNTSTCLNGHSYYRCASDASKHRSGLCESSSGSQEESS